jgi:hypothetical protein
MLLLDYTDVHPQFRNDMERFRLNPITVRGE